MNKTKLAPRKKQGLPVREIRRKALHMLFGTAILALIYFAGTKYSLAILFTCLIIGVIISFMVKKGFGLFFIKDVVEGVERESEKSFPGKAAVFFFASAVILLGIFNTEPTLVIAALSVQVYADAAAALIGMKFGKHKLYKKKTWEGSTACFVVATIVISMFFPVLTALVAAFVATLVELLPLDDNLWVPIITSATLKALI